MLDITVTGVRYQVSEKVKSYIQDKLGGLNRFHPDLHRIEVVIHEAAKFGFRIDVDMHLANHKDLIAHDSESTIYAAIDIVSDKCSKQLRRLHDKETSRGRLRA